jgi:hypothetical protein
LSSAPTVAGRPFWLKISALEDVQRHGVTLQVSLTLA